MLATDLAEPVTELALPAVSAAATPIEVGQVWQEENPAVRCNARAVGVTYR
jgi:hypothetical protein